MKRIMAIVCSGLAALLVVGCGTGSVDSMDDEPVTEVASALENSNALNPNALNPNALNPNALNPNALNPNALQTLQDPGPDGDLSRQLLKYTVSCALDPTQSFSFSWTDAGGLVHAEVYPGLLGLATAWATGPLSSSGQGWVSSCLASRLNWYGVPVTISSRGTVAQLGTTSSERSTYSKIEGAFFGNLFSATPVIYTCYNPENVANSRSRQRDCASGHVNGDGTVSSCGILQILGSCWNFCDGFQQDGKYYQGCSSGSGGAGVEYTTTVTTALP